MKPCQTKWSHTKRRVKRSRLFFRSGGELMVHSDDVSLDHLTRGQIAALLELAEDAARSHSSLPALVTRIPDVLSPLAILHVDAGRAGDGVVPHHLRPETALGLVGHD